MGNRAHVTFYADTGEPITSVYFHWNGQDVRYLLERAHAVTHDLEAGAATFVALAMQACKGDRAPLLTDPDTGADGLTFALSTVHGPDGGGIDNGHHAVRRNGTRWDVDHYATRSWKLARGFAVDGHHVTTYTVGGDPEPCGVCSEPVAGITGHADDCTVPYAMPHATPHPYPGMPPRNTCRSCRLTYTRDTYTPACRGCTCHVCGQDGPDEHGDPVTRRTTEPPAHPTCYLNHARPAGTVSLTTLTRRPT